MVASLLHLLVVGSYSRIYGEGATMEVWEESVLPPFRDLSKWLCCDSAWELPAFIVGKEAWGVLVTGVTGMAVPGITVGLPVAA